jgi:RNA polymerase sigma-70 factor (ECF subfamily)
LYATLLYRSYPRMTQPPFKVQADELFGAVAERLLKALREACPEHVRRFLGMATQHMRWELNDLARRLDNQPAAAELCEGNLPSPISIVSGLTPGSRRVIQAISELPEDEREAFDLVRVQGMTHTEAAQVLGVSTVTVKRRLNCGRLLLIDKLTDRSPCRESPDPS